jgi:osmotically-inducible protein OsmY
MQPPALRRVAAALALTAALGVACGEESPEEKLARAREELNAAEEALADRKARVEEREKTYEDARAALDGARDALREAEQRVDAAEAQVASFATDDLLFRAVQKRLLEEERLRDVAISASVQNGVVTLSGDVPDPELRDHAVAVAGDVAGVRSVRSELRVGQPAAASPTGAAPPAPPARP